MENESFVLEMLKELKSNAKRWFIISIVELVIILIGAGLFVWYLNTPVEEVEDVTYTQDADTEGDNSPITQQIGE